MARGRASSVGEISTSHLGGDHYGLYFALAARHPNPDPNFACALPSLTAETVAPRALISGSGPGRDRNPAVRRRRRSVHSGRSTPPLEGEIILPTISRDRG